MKNGQIVREMWDSFAAKVLRPNASEIQYTEMRRAFYAGCYGLLQECKWVGGDDVSEDEGVARFESIDQELIQFYRDLKAGKV